MARRCRLRRRVGPRAWPSCVDAWVVEKPALPTAAADLPRAPKVIARRPGVLQALIVSTLPASLYEEVRVVATPVVLAWRLGPGSGAAMGVAHMYAVELLMSLVVARLCRRQEALSLGRLLLLASWLNFFGLVGMALGALDAAGAGLWLFVAGHATYTLGAMMRDVVFPALVACFPVGEINQATASKRALGHVGALLGGGLLALRWWRMYALAQLLGTALSLRLLSRTLPRLERLDLSVSRAPHRADAAALAELGHAGALRRCPPRPSASSPSPLGRFALLVAARFLISAGVVSTSAAVMLPLLESRLPAEARDLSGAASLLVGGGVVGHVAGLAANLTLVACRFSYCARHLLLASSAYVAAMAALLAVGSVPQYLLATVALRGARTAAKAASDAIAFRTAKGLGATKSTALLSRRMAFKLGLLAGKYCLATSLSVVGGELGLSVAIGAGVLASSLAMLLHLPACLGEIDAAA